MERSINHSINRYDAKWLKMMAGPVSDDDGWRSKTARHFASARPFFRCAFGGDRMIDGTGSDGAIKEV